VTTSTSMRHTIEPCDAMFGPKRRGEWTTMEDAFGLGIPRTIEDVCDRRRTALIVYNMQAGIVAQLPDGPAVTARVVRIRQAAREGGFRVFYTRHLSLPKEVAGMTQLRTALAWQRVDRVVDVTPRFLRDDTAFQSTPELTPDPSEAVFDKITMSAFVGTPLDLALRDCGLDSFVIVGIALEVGIEPTVRHATDLGYIPIVVTDSCGSRDKAAAQRSLDSLTFAGGSLQTDIETVCDLFRRERPTRSR
jgi:nicotinamidase-related amidase